MLLTQCPRCDTTFRVTADALAKAGGQVRCGICANDFDAFAEPVEAADDNERMPWFGRGLGTETNPGGGDPRTEPEWIITSERAPNAKRLPWQLGVLAAFVLLAGQNVHYFRGVLAKSAWLGPPLQEVYAWFGQTVFPAWNVDQYQVIDWIATAEPAANGHGDLVVTAKIRNGAGQPQPFPHVRLELKDRWETVVGSRVFRPNEYLDAEVPAQSFMPPGETAQARLTVVDPGPDAYGFELDVCVELAPNRLSCADDQIFR